MNDTEIDNYVHRLWMQYQTDDKGVNEGIGKLLEDIREKLLNVRDIIMGFSIGEIHDLHMCISECLAFHENDKEHQKEYGSKCIHCENYKKLYDRITERCDCIDNVKQNEPTKIKKEFETYIKEIDDNTKLKKKYLINDLIKIRVHSLLKAKSSMCTYSDCNLPIDNTALGWDTSCPYHRLLFDHWLCEITDINSYKTQQGKRSAFTQWVNKAGKKQCDAIVDEMSKVPINWKC